MCEGICVYMYAHVNLLLAEKKMLGLSKVCEITAGSNRPSESQILDLISSGAVAVSAIMGASVNALSPPSC